MNRKNLTCAVLAGLAGVAGLAATAQAVNLNPDGLGQVLVYPYYTANDGNQTILSVVNTTEQAKAVKVRFLEGFNSREVLDFNLYMSHHDVWVASIADEGDGPILIIPDNSCTVPYLYDIVDGKQPFLDLRYTGDFEDGGPTSIQRAAEGHFEMIEMGVLTGDSAVDVTHDPITGIPADCAELSKKWTEVVGGDVGDSGIWWEEANGVAEDDCPDTTAEGEACTDMARSSGGLFGGAAVVNADNGTMYSYDAKAIQGFDKSPNGLHYEPGDELPSLASGDQDDSWVFFGVPQNTAVELDYNNSVDAVSSVFMHEHVMNEYVTVEGAAGTEWVVTFPTKAFYADEYLMDFLNIEDREPCPADPDPEDPPCDPDKTDILPRAPFTNLFGAEDCEVVSLKTWDRDERTFSPEDPENPVRPPVVSPAPPDPVCEEGVDEECTETVFQLCNEVNVLRFGEQSVFGTPDFGDDGSLLLSVEDEFAAGWGRMNFGGRTDEEGLVGLPVTGFAAWEFENNYAEGGTIKAFYGGLFQHKGNVRRVDND
ncbi:hypothetical protein ACFL1C_07645 [Pseudomonadota bacterium]